MTTDDFYIGWMGGMPRSFAAFIKRYVLVLVPVVLALAALIALSQKKFSTGNFEFGTLTQVEGTYFKSPVPNIRVVSGKDIWGNSSHITIPLVGYGKFGADGIMNEIEQKKQISIDGKLLTLKGTLLYNDGKVLMQVDGNDNPVTNVAQATIGTNELLQRKDLGNIKVKGEIVDPKCFFGVMKPGEGKPHKDCAIRCILGGIPPVLHVSDKDGKDNYYLIVGANGEKMNKAVQDYVAAPVEISAKAVQYNDWIILYVSNGNIAEISRSALYQHNKAMACIPCN